MNNSLTISILGQNGGEAQGEPPDGAMAAIRRNGDGFDLGFSGRRFIPRVLLDEAAAKLEDAKGHALLFDRYLLVVGFEPHAIGSFVFAADDEGFMTDVSFMLSAFLSEEARTGALMALMALELGFENEEESE
jgi:hypothetical protein